MRYRKLDAKGDYTLGSGSDFLVNSPEAVAQAIWTRLRLWKGEWFLDNTEGTDYVNKVLGKHYGSNPDAEIRQRILLTNGVKQLSSYSSSFDGSTRTWSITATVDTVYGQATITGTL